MRKQGEVLWKARGGDVESATEKELRSTAAQQLGEPLPLLSLLSPSARQRADDGAFGSGCCLLHRRDGRR